MLALRFLSLEKIAARVGDVEIRLKLGNFDAGVEVIAVRLCFGCFVLLSVLEDLTEETI